MTPNAPVRFDEFMERALYSEPDGFYAAGRGAGRRGGDFLTSVEVGPLFGRLVARLADRWWDDLGRPADFTFVDAGAGACTLARSVLTARPACGEAGALHYVLVERSAALRQAHEQLLAAPPGPCAGLESQADLPDDPITGLVFANELLDNLPCRLLERTPDGWAEVYVAAEEAADGVTAPPPDRHRDNSASAADSGLDPSSPPATPDAVVGSPCPPTPSGHRPHDAAVAQSARRLTEQLAPVASEIETQATALAPNAPVGARIPLAEAAVEWLRRAASLLRAGRLVLIDYADTTASLADRNHRDWVRTYRSGLRGHDPLMVPGSADITVEVPIDQVLAALPGAEVCDQASFLRTLGIDDLVAAGRTTWQERAAVGDLAAIEARSRIGEAEALCDPSALGSFTVATWQL